MARGPNFTPEELAIIRSVYPERGLMATVRALAAAGRHRHKETVRNVAKRMGLRLRASAPLDIEPGIGGFGSIENRLAAGGPVGVLNVLHGLVVAQTETIKDLCRQIDLLDTGRAEIEDLRPTLRDLAGQLARQELALADLRKRMSEQRPAIGEQRTGDSEQGLAQSP